MTDDTTPRREDEPEARELSEDELDQVAGGTIVSMDISHQGQ